MRKGYTDGPFGQIHWRMMDAVAEATMPDLYCLHPSPFSGLAYTNVMPMLAQNRRVIAPDYPGYGGSDPFKAHPSIAEYAEAMLAVMDVDENFGGSFGCNRVHGGTRASLSPYTVSLFRNVFELEVSYDHC